MAVSPGSIKAGGAHVVIGVSDRLSGPMKQMSRRLNRWGSQIQGIGLRIAAAGGAMTTPFVLAVKAASNAQESLSRFEQVFGNLTGRASEFAKVLADGVGRSSIDIKDALGTFQSFFVGLGFARERALELSKQMETLSIDFASFNNLSDGEAQQRFIAALSGSGEVLDRFGINIKQAALQQELLRMGVAKSWSAVTEQEKAVARLNIIMRAMTDQGAVGDAVRTAASFANQMKRLHGSIKDTSIAVGQALLPPLTTALQKINAAAKFTSDWVDANRGVILVSAGVAATVLSAGGALLGLGLTLKIAKIAIFGYAKAFAAVRFVTAALAIDTALLGVRLAGLKYWLASTGVVLAIPALFFGTAYWAIQANKHVAQLQSTFEGFGKSAGTLDAVNLEMQEIGRNIAELNKEIATGEWADFTTVAGAEKSIADAVAKRDEQYRRLLELAKMRRGLGETGAPTAEDIEDIEDIEAMLAEKQRQQTIADWARSVHQLRIAFIEDEERRAVASVNERYDHELKAARENAEAMKLIERARQLELFKLARDFANRQAELQKQVAEQADAERQRGADAQQGQQDRINRLGLQVRFGNDPAELARRMLKLERAEAVRGALGRGESVLKVIQEFDLRENLQKRGEEQAIIDQANELTMRNAREQAELWENAVARSSVVSMGQFGGGRAGQLLAATSDADRIVKKLDEVKQAVKDNKLAGV